MDWTPWVFGIASIAYTILTLVYLLGRRSETLTRADDAIRKLEGDQNKAREALRNEANANFSRLEARLETLRVELHGRIEKTASDSAEARGHFRNETTQRHGEFVTQINGRMADFEQRLRGLERVCQRLRQEDE